MLRREMAASRRPPDEPTGRTRDKLTVLVTPGLADRVRDAAWFLRLTVSEIAGVAIERELTRLERQHGQGKPFPRRGGPVKTGRPLKRRSE